MGIEQSLSLTELKVYAPIARRLIPYDPDLELGVDEHHEYAYTTIHEVVGVLRTLKDDESFIAACVGSDNVAFNTPDTTKHQPPGDKELAVYPTKVYEAFGSLLEAFKSQDNENLQAARVSMDIDDELLWRDILYNFEHYVYPTLAAMGVSSAEDFPQETLGTEEGQDFAMWLAQTLTAPTRDYNMTLETADLTFRALVILALINPARARRVYQEMLSDQEDYYSVAELVVGGLRHLTCTAGKNSLVAWRQALSHPNKKVRDTTKKELDLAISEVYESLSDPEAAQQVPRGFRFSFDLLGQLRTLKGDFELR